MEEKKEKTKEKEKEKEVYFIIFDFLGLKGLFQEQIKEDEREKPKS